MFESWIQAAQLIGGIILTLSVCFYLAAQVLLFAFGDPNGTKYIKVEPKKREPLMANLPKRPDPRFCFVSTRYEKIQPRKIDEDGMEIIDRAEIERIKAKIHPQQTISVNFEIID